MINDKKVLFSGMQATGNLTLGNYLGALKNWVTNSFPGRRRRNCWPTPAPSADRKATEDVTNEKTAEFCKVAHHCRGAGRNGRDDGGRE